MKTKRFFPAVILLSLFLTYNCTASVKTTAAADNTNTEIADESLTTGQQNPNQPRTPRYGATPEDSVKCIRNLSLYQEFYNQGNRQMAWEPWREVFLNCPQASQNTFIRGAILVKMKYSQETDPIRREAWIDTLMMVYDQRIQYFGNVPQSREGLVLGRKAVDLFQLRPNNTLPIYEMTKRSILLERNNSQADVILIYMQSLIRMVEAGLLPTGEILLAYDQVMAIIDHNIANNTQDNNLYVQAKNNVEIMFEPFATCENIIALYGPRFNNTPNNIELLEKVTSMLSKASCTDSDLFYKTTLNLHKLKPTAQSAFMMARMESSSQNYREALNFYQQAIDLYQSDSDKFTAYLLMADMSFRQLRQFAQARTYALQASALAPNNGRPLLLIGEMYATSANQCGENDLTKNVAYWAAVDKFLQARNADSDPAVVERATQLINTFSQYFPNREIIFFHGLTEGQTYRVECWINETTRVRAR